MACHMWNLVKAVHTRRGFRRMRRLRSPVWASASFLAIKEQKQKIHPKNRQSNVRLCILVGNQLLKVRKAARHLAALYLDRLADKEPQKASPFFKARSNPLVYLIK